MVAEFEPMAKTNIIVRHLAWRTLSGDGMLPSIHLEEAGSHGARRQGRTREKAREPRWESCRPSVMNTGALTNIASYLTAPNMITSFGLRIASHGLGSGQRTAKNAILDICQYNAACTSNRVRIGNPMSNRDRRDVSSV